MHVAGRSVGAVHVARIANAPMPCRPANRRNPGRFRVVSAPVRCAQPGEEPSLRLGDTALPGRAHRHRDDRGAQTSPGENTVKSHVHEIFRKLDVGNRAQAALKAGAEGAVS